MSWTLGVDTSSSTLSLGLLHEGRPVISTSRYVKNSHSEHIANVIKSFLSLSEISATDITRAVVVTGPGSFTGLRIGISFIKGLFANTGTLVYPLSSLENMAEAYPTQNGIINTVIDARQDFVFHGQFLRNNGILTRIKEDDKVSLEQLLTDIEPDHITLYDTAGNVRSTIPEVLADMKSEAFDVLNLPTGLSAALRGESLVDAEGWDEAINIFPNYMQESYAERTRKK